MAEGPIIVPLDGSRSAENALPVARTLASLSGAHVRIIRVAEAHEAARIRNVSEVDQQFTEYALREARLAGIDEAQCSVHLLVGQPAASILKDATEQLASAIVIASRGRSGVRAAIIGSVADKVVRGAVLPVLVVPGVGEAPSGKITSILVSLDGSEDSERALGPARQIASGLGAQLTLMRAYSIVPPVATGYDYWAGDVAEASAEGAKEYLAAKAREGERAVVSQGDASAAIVETAEKIDATLVVMAASGKGLAGRVFLGSTTDRVLHSLGRRLLLIVRPPEQA